MRPASCHGRLLTQHRNHCFTTAKSYYATSVLSPIMKSPYAGVVYARVDVLTSHFVSSKAARGSSSLFFSSTALRKMSALVERSARARNSCVRIVFFFLNARFHLALHAIFLCLSTFLSRSTTPSSMHATVNRCIPRCTRDGGTLLGEEIKEALGVTRLVGSEENSTRLG